MHHQIYSGDRITYGNFTPSPITFGEGEGVKGYFDAYPFRLHQIYSGDRRSPLAPVPRTPKGYRGTCVLSSISVPRRGIGEGVRGTGDYLRFYESKIWRIANILIDKITPFAYAVPRTPWLAVPFGDARTPCTEGA